MFKNIFKRRKKEEQLNEFYGDFGDSPRMSKAKKIFFVSVSVFTAIAVAFVICFFTMFYVEKDYEYVSSFSSLPWPVQTEKTGQLKWNVDDYEITVDIMAEYTLYGLVVEKHYYPPYRIANKLGRFDFGMVYGPLLGVDVFECMKFRNDGRRFLHYEYPLSLANKLGGRDVVLDSVSNNHMVHADEHVLKLLRNVKEGDYIKIEGYLVYLYYSNEDGRGEWTSSLTRTDRGDGACEVIYVKNITWLKTK